MVSKIRKRLSSVKFLEKLLTDFKVFSKSCVYKLPLTDFNKGNVTIEYVCTLTLKKCCPLYCPFWKNRNNVFKNHALSRNNHA